MFFYQYFYLIIMFTIITSKASTKNITQRYSIRAGFNIILRYLLLEQLADIIKL